MARKRDHREVPSWLAALTEELRDGRIDLEEFGSMVAIATSMLCQNETEWEGESLMHFASIHNLTKQLGRKLKIPKMSRVTEKNVTCDTKYIMFVEGVDKLWISLLASSQAIETKRAADRERQRRYRARKKEHGTKNVTRDNPNVSHVTGSADPLLITDHIKDMIIDLNSNNNLHKKLISPQQASPPQTPAKPKVSVREQVLKLIQAYPDLLTAETEQAW